jgi:hypothetical protein
LLLHYLASRLLISLTLSIDFHLLVTLLLLLSLTLLKYRTRSILLDLTLRLTLFALFTLLRLLPYFASIVTTAAIGLYLLGLILTTFPFITLRRNLKRST